MPDHAVEAPPKNSIRRISSRIRSGRRRCVLCGALAAGSLVLGLASLHAPDASAAAPTVEAHYGSKIIFSDGSSLSTSDTGSVTTTPATSGKPPGSFAAALAQGMRTTVPESKRASSVVPLTATPSGFRLYGTNRASSYIYNSDVLATLLTKRVGNKVSTIGQVNVGFQEYLNGGKSHVWKITVKTARTSGPAYGVTFHYWCGVSVSGPDHTCDTHQGDATPPYSDEIVAGTTGNLNYPEYADFGSGETGNTKFPMLQVQVTWPGKGDYLVNGVSGGFISSLRRPGIGRRR